LLNIRLACVRRLTRAGTENPSGNPLTLCQPAHKYTVGQAPLFPWCHFTGEIIVCGVRWYLVWLKYCVASRCLAMVVAEQATEALPPYHWTRVATNVPLACDQLVRETLMIALRMIVGQVLVDRIIEGTFT
jgi:hypothetical protein